MAVDKEEVALQSGSEEGEIEEVRDQRIQPSMIYEILD